MQSPRVAMQKCLKRCARVRDFVWRTGGSKRSLQNRLADAGDDPQRTLKIAERNGEVVQFRILEARSKKAQRQKWVGMTVRANHSSCSRSTQLCHSLKTDTMGLRAVKKLPAK